MFRMADYRAMSKQLDRLIELSKNVKKELDAMKDSAAELDIFWDGEANAEFFLKFNEGMYNINLLLEKIKRAGLFLSYALSRYQGSEQKINEMIAMLK